VQGQIVALDLETLRREVLYVSRATVDGEHPITVVAVEVVVMVIGLPMVGLARRLVACGLARQVNAQHLPVLQQGLQLSIHRREIQARHGPLRELADFLWRQRTVAFGESGQHCVALAGLTFHAAIILQMHSRLQYYFKRGRHTLTFGYSPHRPPPARST
jgi:hypothetical protein